MTLPTFKRIALDGDPAQLQDNVMSALTPLLKNPLADGIMLTGITLSSGVANSVNHGLGRALQGWLLIDNIVGCHVWRTTSTMPAKTIILHASANTTVALWVF